ncbi:MAG: YbjN domain-containing protein [Rhodobacteraceae bacterium]|nr:YbjN domain-containing protein [Paracoccaceae bacterium]
MTRRDFHPDLFGDDMRHLSFALLFIGCSVAASASNAADLLTATAPEPIAALMQGAGLQAEIDKDPSGDPLIKSAVQGANFNVLFYGCTAGKDCTSVQFFSCFKLDKPATLDVINKWNVEMRYGKAILDESQNACLQQDINMAAGIAPDTMNNILDNWSQVLGKFTTALGY